MLLLKEVPTAPLVLEKYSTGTDLRGIHGPEPFAQVLVVAATTRTPTHVLRVLRAFDQQHRLSMTRLNRRSLVGGLGQFPRLISTRRSECRSNH